MAMLREGVMMRRGVDGEEMNRVERKGLVEGRAWWL